MGASEGGVRRDGDPVDQGSALSTGDAGWFRQSKVPTVVYGVVDCIRFAANWEFDFGVHADVAPVLSELIGFQPAASVHVAEADDQALGTVFVVSRGRCFPRVVLWARYSS